MDIQTFDSLPHEFARKFVPQSADMSNLDTVLNLFRRLEERVVTNADDFSRFADDLFELRAVLREAFSKVHILSTCHTDDEEIARQEKHFNNVIFPGVAEIANRIDQRFVESFRITGADEQRYGTAVRAREADILLFRKENIPLSTELANLSQKYFAIRGAVSVEFDGQERTMSEMFKFLESADRTLRERAWRARQDAEKQCQAEIDDLYDRMISLRDLIAHNAGFTSFTDYMFQVYKRFDYSPDDCLRFHDAIEAVVVPLLRRVHDEKIQRLGLDSLKPWDIYVDPQGGEPLAPFADASELIERMRRLMQRMDQDFDRWFALMDQYGLLDLSTRKGKAPGGYSATLTEHRFPFIFMNAAGTDWDVRVLLHELGHSFHSFSLREDLLNYVAHSPMEFNEVASMSLELLGSGFLDEFYPENDAIRRSNARLLERIIALFTSVATVDGFQHWIYSHPQHTREERGAAWKTVCDRFSSGLVDWTGCEEYQQYGWQSILHIVNLPFYYVEYGIAQIGALQVWRNSRQDFSAAMNQYKQGLAAGNSRTLPELYDATGIQFNFGEPLLRDLMAEVESARFS